MNKKTISKKIFSFVIALFMVAGCASVLVGCGNKKASKVMNMSLNPSIEVVLDKDDKVVSVNALNDEGNYIVANVSFEGLTAKEAVNEFLKATKESGFSVQGDVSATENQLKLEISGENAEKLYKKVRKSAEKYLEEIDLNVEISLTKLDTNYLKAQVKECMQELSDSEISEKSEEELIALIKESRAETKDLLSEELKDLYYQTRAEEILKQKFEAVNSLISQSSSIIVKGYATLMETAFNTFTSSVSQFRTLYVENFLSETSTYQKEMKKYIEAKKEVLKTRLNETSEQQKEELSQNLEEAKQSLEEAKTFANDTVKTINSAIDTTISTMQGYLDLIILHLNVETINQAISTAKAEVKAEFSEDYAAYISVEYWKDLSPLENVG